MYRTINTCPYCNRCPCCGRPYGYQIGYPAIIPSVTCGTTSTINNKCECKKK